MAEVDARHPQQLRRILGALLGTGIGFALARQLPVVPSTLLSALVLALGASWSGAARAPLQWWGLIGAACGALLGTSTVLAAALNASSPAGHWGERALTVLVLALAGAIAGRNLNHTERWAAHQQPKALLRSASALTTGIFAGIVTLTYIHAGLDPARTFSSRLSTSLTILVMSLAAPGWLSHLLSRRREPSSHER